MSPQFADLNGDGAGDLLVGNFSGFLHYLPAVAGGDGFAEETRLTDKSGAEIHAGQYYGEDGWEKTVLVPGAPDDILGVYPDLADWDGDGDLDLMIGGRRGCIALRINEGADGKAEFSAEPRYVEVGGAILDLEGHVSSDLVDVDGDGRLDLVCAEDGGAITWYRNESASGEPVFSEATPIASAGDDGPANYLRVSAADLNGDGKCDLLVGAKDAQRKPGIWVFYQR